MAKYYYNNNGEWDWDYAKEDLEEAFNLKVWPSAYDFPHYEEQSVRWNREEIVRRNAARKAEEQRLIEYRNQQIAEVGANVAEAIAEYFVRDYVIDEKKSQLYANEIWNAVINDEDMENDVNKIFKHIDNYIVFLIKIIKEEKDN